MAEAASAPVGINSRAQRYKKAAKKEAEEIKENIEKFLWDKDFYKTIPLGIDEENPLQKENGSVFFCIIVGCFRYLGVILEYGIDSNSR